MFAQGGGSGGAHRDGALANQGPVSCHAVAVERGHSRDLGRGLQPDPRSPHQAQAEVERRRPGRTRGGLPRVQAGGAEDERPQSDDQGEDQSGKPRRPARQVRFPRGPRQVPPVLPLEATSPVPGPALGGPQGNVPPPHPRLAIHWPEGRGGKGAARAEGAA